jgi:hypothetical protein
MRSNVLKTLLRKTMPLIVFYDVRNVFEPHALETHGFSSLGLGRRKTGAGVKPFTGTYVYAEKPLEPAYLKVFPPNVHDKASFDALYPYRRPCPDVPGDVVSWSERLAYLTLAAPEHAPYDDASGGIDAYGHGRRSCFQSRR